MDILKWLASFLPRDSSNDAGYGPFRLPSPECDWMQPVFVMHDHYYDVGPDTGMTLSEIDWRVFKSLTIAAEQAETYMERCHRAMQIAKYWPIMRRAGHLLYNRQNYRG